MKNGLIFKNMKKIYSLAGWVMIAAGMGALPAGCGTEVEFEEPDFEVAVDFDFNTVRFDWDGYTESQLPSFKMNFRPCYYKVVEKPEWVEVSASYGSGWCGVAYSSDYKCVVNLHCDSNPSESPRSGIVKVVVSNVMKDEVISRDSSDGILEVDLPVYRFESEFTVTQEGRPGGEQ